MQTGFEIFVVDDDAAVRDALGTLLQIEGFMVTGLPDGHSLISAVRNRSPACILLDVNMQGRSGLDVLRELNAQHLPVPIFIMSGQGDIPMAVEAIKNGALDFIEKPFDADTLVSQVRAAVEGSDKRLAKVTDVALASFPGREHLTPREREVLTYIAGGASNKEAGRILAISPRTIEVHRARIMEKLSAKNAADLVRIVMSDGR